jgi:hypothetical protein
MRERRLETDEVPSILGLTRFAADVAGAIMSRRG